MRLFFLRLLILVTLALPLSAVAQTLSPSDAEWEQTATSFEDEIADPETSTERLREIRSQITKWREEFLDAQNINRNRINTLESQIEALGPEPAEGESEPDEIAERRDELNDRLDEALIPVREAEQAFTRADGLVAEIDAKLNERQTDELLQLYPSPLNPTHWPQAAASLVNTTMASWTHVRESLSQVENRQQLRANGLVIAGLLVFAAIFLRLGRKWSRRFTEYASVKVPGQAGSNIVAFLASLLEILIPMLGFLAIIMVPQLVGIFGERATVVFSYLPVIGLFYLTFMWIVGRLLAVRQGVEPRFQLSTIRRAEATGHMAAMSIVLGLKGFLDAWADIDDYSDATISVLTFPLLLVGGLSLWRLAKLLADAVPQTDNNGGDDADDEEDEDYNPPSFIARIVSTLSKIILIAGLAGIAAGALGFTTAGSSIVFPSILTLALLGLVAIFHGFFTDVYVLIMRDSPDAREGLVPVLIACILAIAAMPVMLIIWGMRPEQIGELWVRAREGISVGDVTISPSSILTFIIIFAICFGLTGVAKSALATTVLPKTKLDKGAQGAFVSGVGYVGVFLSALIAITTAGIDLSALALVFGALSVGIGFGLQNIVQNFVSGIILLIERPISKGDWIEVGGQMGFVRDISVRSTRVETFDRTDVIVPNADLISNQVTNYTRGNMVGRVIVPVGVAYGTDTKKVEGILREIAEEQPMVALNPPPQVLFMNFGSDALEFEVRAILRNVTYIVQVRNDINHAIAKRFAEEGIEIPFAQRDVWLRNPEALRQPTSSTEDKPSEPFDPVTASTASDFHQDGGEDGDVE